MKTREFRRWLEALGVRIEEGSKHTKLYFQGKQSTLPRHTEIPDLLVKQIRKQLGIEQPPP